jgi:hypothetical protein
MVTTLGGITLNISKDTPKHKADLQKNKIASSAKYRVHNSGVTNIGWAIKGWVSNDTEHKALVALMGQGSLTFVDKAGDSYTVTIETLEFERKNFNHEPYSMVIMEVI